MRHSEHETAEKLFRIIAEHKDAHQQQEMERYARAELAAACIRAMATDFSLVKTTSNEPSEYAGVSEQPQNEFRHFRVSNPLCIPPIYGIPGWPKEMAQFEIEAGPPDVFELADLRCKPGYIFNPDGTLDERGVERQRTDEEQAELRWIQSLRVYFRLNDSLRGSRMAIYNQTMLQGQAAAMFTDATAEDDPKWAIIQFVSLGQLAEFVIAQSEINERGYIRHTSCTFQAEWVEWSLAKILRSSERYERRRGLFYLHTDLGSRARQAWRNWEDIRGGQAEGSAK
jgi:hypothetical protein